MYSRNIQKDKTKNKKLLLIGVVTLVIALLVGLIWAEKSGRIDLLNNNQRNESTTSDEDSSINYNPPTEDEAKSGDEVPIKQDETDQNGTEPTQEDSNQANNVSVIISDAGVYDGNVEVSAFTPDAIANGTCTLTFTSGSKKVTKTVQARADASSSICIDEPFPASELSASKSWNLEVTYESTSKTYKGSKTTTLNL